MRVLICGGREASREQRLAVTRWVKGRLSRGDVVIHGAASGIDEAAGAAAKIKGLRIEAYPADWKTHGRAAGPIRNRQMLVDGKPDLVVAFPGGRGTANMVRQAREHGVAVEVITP